MESCTIIKDEVFLIRANLMLVREVGGLRPKKVGTQNSVGTGKVNYNEYLEQLYSFFFFSNDICAFAFSYSTKKRGFCILSGMVQERLFNASDCCKKS